MTADANLGSRPSRRPLIAPAWHAIVFIAIFLGLSIVAGFFQPAVKQQPQATVSSGNPVPGYISVVVFEWLRVLYVRMGVHQRGMRLRDLVGGRWATPKRGDERHRSRRGSVGGVDWPDECSRPGRRNQCGAGTSSSRDSEAGDNRARMV